MGVFTSPNADKREQPVIKGGKARNERTKEGRRKSRQAKSHSHGTLVQTAVSLALAGIELNIKEFCGGGQSIMSDHGV